ncbi:TPA: hypothetical protein HA351_00265 [Methanosarcinaceae archaeon]|nr:hypothetical protein [Methanosarcinaceae archaeon]
MENTFLTILKLSLFETFCVTGLLILIGLILGIIGNRANFYIQRVFGWKGIMLTAWIGTPVHESGHRLMCYLFRHNVKEFKLLALKRKDGVLGYVQHGWDPKSLYQNIGNFFIGMGPIFSGTAALILGMYLLLPASFSSFSNFLALEPTRLDSEILGQIFMLTAELFGSIFSAENVGNLNFWIYFALAIGISSHIALSKEDLKGASRGFVTIFSFIFLVNIIALLLKVDFSGFFLDILALNIYLLAFSMVSIAFSSIRLFLSFFAYALAYRIP